MVQFLKSMSTKNFSRSVILASGLNDLLFSIHIYLDIIKNLHSTTQTVIMEMQRVSEFGIFNPSELGPMELESLVSQVVSTTAGLFWGILVVFLTLHLAVYRFFYKGGSFWAKNYLKVLAWSGVLLGIPCVIFLIYKSYWFMWYLFPVPLFYLYIAMGMKLRGRE